MAIVQISQITNRKGLQVNLPQLAGGELGWSVDERRLWIGNGNLEEGAPAIGNTEILTEFSNIPQLLSTTETLNNNVSTPTALITQSSSQVKAFSLNYIIVRGSSYRTGLLTIATDSGASDLTYSDDYVENQLTGISLTVTQVSTAVEINYTSTNTGQIGTITYYITPLA